VKLRDGDAAPLRPTPPTEPQKLADNTPHERRIADLVPVAVMNAKRQRQQMIQPIRHARQSTLGLCPTRRPLPIFITQLRTRTPLNLLPAAAAPEPIRTLDRARLDIAPTAIQSDKLEVRSRAWSLRRHRDIDPVRQCPLIKTSGPADSGRAFGADGMRSRRFP
jgi:hypothetical protein